MKTINTVKYVCDFCNTQYDNLEDAKNCEEYHCKNFKLDDSKHMVYGTKSRFPSFITLVSDTGKKQQYSIDHSDE